MKDGISVAFEMGDEECSIALRISFDSRVVVTQFTPEYARDLAERLITAADVCEEHCELVQRGSDDEPTEPPADASGESVLQPGTDPQPPGR